ncbi:phage head-tail joining protein [Xanthobacter autotrophicus]|uniref:phage head-tail joining protein n=1 Tax=Xanthobacter autotrophicus TaxID=280 RepID=UPI003726CC9C
MAFSQADIDALKKAIGLGVVKVSYADGRSHEYRSLAQMKEILRMMEADVASGAAAEPRVVTIVSGRDW